MFSNKKSILVTICIIASIYFSRPELLFPQNSKNLFSQKETIHFDEIKPEVNFPAFNKIYSVLRTRDGFLWLGTDAGLVRYDGIRFIIFDSNSTNALKEARVEALYEDKKGTLWIGSLNAVISLKNNNFISYYFGDSLHRAGVSAINEDNEGNIIIGTGGSSIYRLKNEKLYPITGFKDIDKVVIWTIYCDDEDGSLWFGTDARGLYIIKNDQLISYSTNNFLPHNRVRHIFKDSKKNIWIATGGGGLVKYSKGKFKTYNTLNGLPSNVVTSIHEDKNGTLWMGTGGGGLVKFKDDKFFRFTTHQGLSNDYINTIFEDDEENFWIGTETGELNKMRIDKVSNFTTRDGLLNNVILTIFEDQAGNIWAGTRGSGLEKINGKQVTHYSIKDGLSNNSIRSVYVDNTKTIWIGTEGGGLNIYKNGKIKIYTAKEGFISNTIQVIYKDKNQNFWVGTRRGLVQFKGEKFRNYLIGEDNPRNNVKAICEDLSGNLWIGSRGGLHKMVGDNFENYGTKNGLLSPNIFCLYPDKDSAIWIGTGRNGLNRYKNGKFYPFIISELTQETAIFYINEDNNGNLWMSSESGIFIINKNDLNLIADGKKNAYTITHIGKEDGMLTSKCSGGQQPAGIRTIDGKFLFPTVNGIVYIDPKNINQTQSTNKPKIIIEEIYSDKIRIPVSSEIEIAAGSKNLEFRFAALSLMNPQKNLYKYKLDNFDKDWIDAGNRSVAYYTNLPAGNYTFRVIACNNNGIWNESGATLEFYLRPYFYQTLIFKFACTVLLIFLIIYGIRHRAKELKIKEKKLMDLVNEKTESLRKSEAKLLESNASKDKFFSIISHDMKNLFGVLVPFTEILKTEFDTLPKDRIKEIIDNLNISSKSLFEMLNNLLEWASLQTDRIICQPIKIITHETGDKIIGLMMETAIKKDVTLINRINESTIVKADRNMLESILQNLIYNAIKFTNPRGQVTLFDTVRDDNFIAISVSDSGIGIKKENIDKLFKIDIKITSVGTANEIGTGLGLILCKDMVEKNGGQIWVESEIGKGTTFTFTLPKG